MTSNEESENGSDNSLASTYVRVVVVEAAIIVLLVIIGHLFS
jgi:hypothetical protein